MFHFYFISKINGVSAWSLVCKISCSSAGSLFACVCCIWHQHDKGTMLQIVKEKTTFQRYSCTYICNLPKHELWVISLILRSKLQILYLFMILKSKIIKVHSISMSCMNEFNANMQDYTWYSKQNTVHVIDNFSNFIVAKLHTNFICSWM